MLMAVLAQGETHIEELFMRWVIIHEWEPATIDVFVFFVQMVGPSHLLDFCRHAMELLGVFEQSFLVESRDIFELKETNFCQHLD